MTHSLTHITDAVAMSHRIRIGDDSFLPALLAGTLHIESLHDSLALPGVLVASGLGRQLLSISKLVSTPGMSVVFPSEGFLVTKNSQVVLEGFEQDGIYIVKGSVQGASPPSSNALVSTSSSDLAYQHSRLNHLSVRLVDRMAKEGRLTGAKGWKRSEIESFSCDSCLLGKFMRTPARPSPLSRATVPGELVHVDLFGPL